MEEVGHVLATGETIENYPEDMPYPSRLLVGCGEEYVDEETTTRLLRNW
jgi:hypothetical protein